MDRLASFAPCSGTENFSAFSKLARIMNPPSKIHTPMAMRNRGQNQLITSPVKRPAAFRKNRSPSRTSRLPQNNSPRRMSTSVRPARAKQAASDHVEAEQDQQHCRPITAEDIQALKDSGEYQEQHRADDQQVDAASQIGAHILAQQTHDDRPDAHKAGDER